MGAGGAMSAPNPNPNPSGGDWDAHRWIAWLRRGPTDPVPSWKALTDCADDLQAEIERLRAALARKVAP